MAIRIFRSALSRERSCVRALCAARSATFAFVTACVLSHRKMAAWARGGGAGAAGDLKDLGCLFPIPWLDEDGSCSGGGEQRVWV